MRGVGEGKEGGKTRYDIRGGYFRESVRGLLTKILVHVAETGEKLVDVWSRGCGERFVAGDDRMVG